MWKPSFVFSSYYISNLTPRFLSLRYISTGLVSVSYLGKTDSTDERPRQTGTSPVPRGSDQLSGGGTVPPLLWTPGPHAQHSKTDFSKSGKHMHKSTFKIIFKGIVSSVPAYLPYL